MQVSAPRLDVPTRILHLGLLVFGTWAWWIGDDAHDYRRPVHDGYDLHMYVGLVFTGFLALRLLWGFFGPRGSRFSTWLPYTRARLALVAADLRTLARLKLPMPVTHQGLNALVQSLGLLLFTWQGASGTLMALLIVPGQRATGWLHQIQELHGSASVWIPIYFVLHIGAAVLHALTGHQIWRKMIFIKE